VSAPVDDAGVAWPTTVGASPARLGLRANLAQFVLLVAVNALVGATLGQERTVVPLLAEQTFGQSGFSSGLLFIVAFGLVRPSRTSLPAHGRTGSAASRSWSRGG
jgi:hypothetical protein